jgi:hypothetical protein
MRTKTRAARAKVALIEPAMDAATAKQIADHNALMVSPLAPLRTLEAVLDRASRPGEVERDALWRAFQDALAPLSLVVHHVRPQEDFTEFCPADDAYGYDYEDEWLRDYVVELRAARDRLAEADPKRWPGDIAEAQDVIRRVLGGLAENGVEIEPRRKRA